MTILKIARREFDQVAFHPLVIILGILILIIVSIDGAGYGLLHGPIDDGQSYNALVYTGIRMIWWLTMAICLIMSSFFGAITIPLDRWKHTYNVLLTKPLRRSDIIAGKFLGLSAFMLVFNIFVTVIAVFLVVAFLNEPLSVLDLVLWTIGYILLATLTCSTIIALNLFFGTVSKSFLVVTTLSFVYISVELFWYKDWLLPGFDWLTPLDLDQNIFNVALMSIQYPSYLGGSAVIDCVIRIAAMLIELSGALLIGTYIFTREDI